MSQGRVTLLVHCAGGRLVVIDWTARSAVHRELTRRVKAGSLVNPQLFVAYDHFGKVAGAGHPAGRGWSSGWIA